MEKQEELALKNIQTQLDLQKKINNAKMMCEHYITDAVRTVDSLIRMNTKYINDEVGRQITLNKEQWETLTALNDIAHGRAISESHSKFINEVKTYQEILKALQ